MKHIASMFLAISMLLALVVSGYCEAQSLDEEITVVNNSQCVIKITGIDPDNLWGYTVDVYLENKSANKTYMFSVTDAAINGIECDPFFATEIAPGKKSNKEISFSDRDLKSKGVGDFTDIELSFKVYDSNDWFADPVAKETTHIYPYGKDKAAESTRKSQSTDAVIVDNNKVSVIVTDYDEDGFWGYTVNLYLENKTDKELMFSVDDVSVNGYMADPFWAKSVGAGKVAYGSLSWSDSTLKKNGIKTVEEIEMTFKIKDANDWRADPIFNEVVTLEP
jgi:hypothetical protein